MYDKVHYKFKKKKKNLGLKKKKRKELREIQISNFQLGIQSNYNDAHWTLRKNEETQWELFLQRELCTKQLLMRKTQRLSGKILYN